MRYGAVVLRLVPLAWLGGCHDGDQALELVGSVERTLVELSAATSEVIVAIPGQRGQADGEGARVTVLSP